MELELEPFKSLGKIKWNRRRSRTAQHWLNSTLHSCLDGLGCFFLFNGHRKTVKKLVNCFAQYSTQYGFDWLCNPVCMHVVQQQLDGDTLIDSSHQTWGSCVSSTARVNHQSHQLAVLSIGWWAAFLHPVPDSVLTQHPTTVNLFGLLTFDPFYLLGVFSPPLTILPSNLVTLIL